MTPITREDLEMAAKAAGLSIDRVNEGLLVTDPNSVSYGYFWAPDENDGDCARMCAAVGIDTEWGAARVDVYAGGVPVGVAWLVDHANDKCAAWRYAAVKLAAAVGRSM